MAPTTRSRSSSLTPSNASSSPSAHTPHASRSRSSSLSSPAGSLHGDLGASTSRAPSHDYDDDDFSDEEISAKKGKARGGKRGAKELGEDEVFDPKSLSLVRCQWGNCGEGFWELEPLMEHLHTVHAHPINPQDAGTKKPLIFNCEWQGCPRRGKNQSTKFALIGHLRSHTGEKPFNCPRPECDKSFTRTDALQKHMRIQHGEVILPSRRPPSKKKKSTARAGSADSDGEESIAGGEEDDQAEQWTEEEQRLFDLHPEQSKGFVAYVVLRAKWAAAMGEAEGLAGEAEVLGLREAELKAECEELVKRVMRRECGEDEPGREQLEKYLNDYSHQPLRMPTGWTGENK